MAGVVVDDPSIGEALGVLSKGLGVMNDPKQRAMAALIQQRMNENAYDIAAKKRAEDAQLGLAAEYDRMLQPERFAGRIPQQFEPQGPMPSGATIPPVPNPDFVLLPDRLAMLRAQTRNQLMNGGAAGQTVAAGLKGLALGDVYAGGIPGQEAGPEGAARRAQTLMLGQLPGGAETFTPAAAQAAAERETDLKIRQDAAKGISVSKDQQFYPSPQQRAGIPGLPAGPIMGNIGANKGETIFTPNGPVYGLEASPQAADAAAVRDNQLARELQAAKGPTVGAGQTWFPSPDEQRVQGVGPGPVRGGVSVGKDTTFTTPDNKVFYGADVDPNAPKTLYPDTTMEGRAGNILAKLSQKAASGQPLTAEEQYAYEDAFNRTYPREGKPHMSVDGVLVNTESRKPVPDNIRYPQELRGLAREQALAGDAPTTEEKWRDPNRKYSDSEERLARFQDAVRRGYTGLSKHLVENNGKPPDLTQFLAGMPSIASNMTFSEFAGNMFRQTQLADPKTKQYVQAALEVMSGTLRPATGAAFGASEWITEMNRYIPLPNDPPELIKSKMDAAYDTMLTTQRAIDRKPPPALDVKQYGTGSNPTSPDPNAAGGGTRERRWNPATGRVE